MRNVPPTAFLMPGGDRVYALRMQMPMVHEDSARTWIHVAFEGRWEGYRDDDGKSDGFEFTRKIFEECVRNFEANPNPVPMDYEHAIVYGEGKVPASGWVQKLEVREDDEGRAHLWAYCELTDTAAEHVRAGEYRFCSGVFDFESHDLVTDDEIGCSMTSLALVNTPFIRGQTPVTLSLSRRQRAGGENMKKETIRALMAISKESLAAALDQIEGDEITPEQLAAAADFAAAKDGKMEDDKSAEEPAMAADEEEEEDVPASAEPPADAAPLADEAEDVALQDPDADAAMAALAPLAERTGMDMAALAAAISENLDAVAAALDGALEEPAMDAPLSDGSGVTPGKEGRQAELSARDRATEIALGAVTKERDKLRSELTAIREREADDAVKVYVDAGFVTDDAAGDLKKLYLSDREAFRRITASMKPRIPTGEVLDKEAPPSTQELPEITPEDEKDEEIKSLRVALSRARVPKALADKAVRERLAARRGARV